MAVKLGEIMGGLGLLLNLILGVNQCWIFFQRIVRIGSLQGLWRTGQVFKMLLV
jgi:hypothetical protein